jgi:cell division protein FtsB
MDKQITEDYDLHVDDQVVHQEKLDKLDLKREITQLEEQIKELEDGS